MALKDYYKILDIPPAADEQLVKKAFRSLAQQYHPDKTNGDKIKEAMYREVQEAYDVLSDKKSREEYNHKRWYTKSLGKSFSEQAVTPAMILTESKRLADFVRSTNTSHLDFDLLSFSTRKIISNENLALLKQAGEKEMNRAIANNIFSATTPLPAKFLEPILDSMKIIDAGDGQLEKLADELIRKRVSKEYWEKRKGAIVISIVVIICWLMYLYAGKM
ncbi:MAG: J domain-containing protein [Chitinophagaceae bacterium]|nr:MAG: J domain-containing protein [Chitinophagaceae bacterium]